MEDLAGRLEHGSLYSPASFFAYQAFVMRRTQVSMMERWLDFALHSVCLAA
jgi:hypothetical protein